MREKPQRGREKGIGVSQRGREKGIGAGNQVLGQVNCLPQCGVAYPNASLCRWLWHSPWDRARDWRLYCASAVRLARSMASAPIG